MSDQEWLTGGGVNAVLRVGNAVRRPTGPWSPEVHRLLRHLRVSGFTRAPSLHEVTPGFEVLDFIPGDVCNYPVSAAAASEAALLSAAELLRDYHDHTVLYAAGAPVEGWMLSAIHPVEVICHGDYAPHNVVLNGVEAVGIIDFDTAHPGPRLWDVAYAVYRWAPVTAPSNVDGFGDADAQATRAGAFCDRYGLDEVRRGGLVDAIIARLHALVAFMREQAAAGNAAFASHLADGHHTLYLADAAYLADTREVFERQLGARP